MVRRFLGETSAPGNEQLHGMIHDYLAFREEAAAFQKRFFSKLCTQKCFTSRMSACCGREGIGTFFADVLINALMSTEAEVDDLVQILSKDSGGPKCVYLIGTGCAWRIKPIVCEMFLCQHAKDTVFGSDKVLAEQWDGLRQKERQYTWPDGPVLFDAVEDIFIRQGYDSPLMYCHKSPGLRRLKAKAARKGSNPAPRIYPGKRRLST